MLQHTTLGPTSATGNVPLGTTARIAEWDTRTRRRLAVRRLLRAHGVQLRGCFHHITDPRIVQTRTHGAIPDDAALETMTVEDLGDDRTRLHVESLVDSFEVRDAWHASARTSASPTTTPS